MNLSVEKTNTSSLRSDGEQKNHRDNREWKMLRKCIKSKIGKSKGKSGKGRKGNNRRGEKQKTRKRPRTFNKRQRSERSIKGAVCPNLKMLSKSDKLMVFGWIDNNESKTKERMANHLYVEKCRHANWVFF